MLGSDGEVPLGEVDDPALGHGLKALLALAVVPQPDPGVLVHLHRQEGYSGVLRGYSGVLLHLPPSPGPWPLHLHHQPPGVLIQPGLARRRGEPRGRAFQDILTLHMFGVTGYRFSCSKIDSFLPGNLLVFCCFSTEIYKLLTCS